MNYLLVNMSCLRYNEYQKMRIIEFGMTVRDEAQGGKLFMKKIAMISDGWKRLITYAWVAGIMSKVEESEEDICLYQYNCYGNWSRDELHNKGEYNIYHLPHLSCFDGIILDCNNIVDRQQLEKTIELLRASNVPVVSIGYDIEGFYYAGIDNKAPLMEMMEHLYSVHGCRRFVFAGGPEDNYENANRIEAYKKSLKKFGLDVQDNPYYYGDYDFNTGVRYFHELVKGKDALPDAFVCASDNIASGMCAEAEKYGYHIPEDFVVTGFDDLDKAAFFRPQITTIGHERETIGYKCVEILIDLWKGKTVNKYNFVPAKCIYAESCGCSNSGVVDYREYTKNQIIFGVKKQAEDELLMDLECDMQKCSSYNEIFACIADYFAKLDCDGFYIVVDKRLFSAELDVQFSEDGYEWEELVVGYATEKKAILQVESVDALHQYMDEHGSGSAYMYTPIHFREKAVGFTIMKNGSFLYDNPYFYDIHSTIVRVMENLFKQKQLENMNITLKDIYNKDPMTGVYNRIAYAEMIQPEFRKYQEIQVPCALLFMDVDHFKKINDTMGHEYGDQVLKTLASALQEQCPEGGYVFRFGGDEFVMFYPNASEENIEQLKGVMRDIMARSDVQVSMGSIITNWNEGKTLDDYLAMADERMYGEKMKGR